MKSYSGRARLVIAGLIEWNQCSPSGSAVPKAHKQRFSYRAHVAAKLGEGLAPVSEGLRAALSAANGQRRSPGPSGAGDGKEEEVVILDHQLAATPHGDEQVMDGPNQSVHAVWVLDERQV